jgi:hypothetical protein
VEVLQSLLFVPLKRLLLMPLLLLQQMLPLLLLLQGLPTLAPQAAVLLQAAVAALPGVLHPLGWAGRGGRG